MVLLSLGLSSLYLAWKLFKDLHCEPFQSPRDSWTLDVYLLLFFFLSLQIFISPSLLDYLGNLSYNFTNYMLQNKQQRENFLETTPPPPTF